MKYKAFICELHMCMHALCMVELHTYVTHTVRMAPIISTLHATYTFHCNHKEDIILLIRLMISFECTLDVRNIQVSP